MRNSDEVFSLEITDIANGGQGIGRHRGKPVFVPYTIPGEKITARPVNDRGRYVFAEGVQVISPSADRILPECQHFGPGRCPGCQWQHMNYQAQLALKTDIVADQLSRIGGFEDAPVKMTLGSPKVWEYNHQATFYPLPGGKLVYKFEERWIDIEECPITVPEILDLVATLDLDLPTLTHVKIMDNGRGEQMIILSTADDQPPELELDFSASVNFLTGDNEPANLIGSTHLVYEILGHSYRVTAGSFFRSNLEQIETLLHTVLNMLQIRGDENALDLYAGTGIFASVLAPEVSLVTCIESYPPAATDAEENLQDFDNVDVIEGSVSDVLADLDEKYQITIVDPPPQGMDTAAIDAFEAILPGQVVYIGQDTATMARDMKRLAERYGYTLKAVQPIDFEPQTFRTVCVAYLTGKS